MSTTPRTDEAVQRYRFLGGGPLELEGRFADFARTLETELAAACSLQALACRKLDAAEIKLAAMTLRAEKAEATNQRYETVFVKIAEIVGIKSPLELYLFEENDDEIYADLLAKAVSSRFARSCARAEKAEAECVDWRRLLQMSRDDREHDLEAELAAIKKVTK